PPTWRDIEQEAMEIRQRGFAVSHGQIAGPDMIGVSSAFFDTNGRVRGSVGVIAPEFRMMSEQQTRVETLVSSKARQLSRDLGYRPNAKGSARHRLHGVAEPGRTLARRHEDEGRWAGA